MIVCIHPCHCAFVYFTIQYCIAYSSTISLFQSQDVSEWNCSLPSVSYCWWSFISAISHVLSLLQSVTLLASSLDAAPVCQLLHCTTALFSQSCLTLCDPKDCSPPGSSVYGIFQARILEWVAISFSRRSSRPRDQARVFCVAGRCFTVSYLFVWKHYKPITVWYYIASCVTRIPRPTLLDLCTNWSVLSEQNSFICGGLTV